MLTDNQIITQILEGDTQAYRHLVDKYRDMAYTVALKLMKDESRAEEIAQESFIKAYEKLSKFKGDASYSTWLYTIVYRTAIYHLRKNNPIVELDIESYNLTNVNDVASKIMIAQEEKLQVRNAIDQLPRLEAMIITLYYLDGKSVDEIAIITRLSQANIKVKLFRARKKLKKILEPILDHG